MHMNTHAHAWHRPHAEALIRRPTIYAQICIHIHIHMCVNAYIYIYIHTCIYIHIYMSAHIHTYTYNTHTNKMYICTHTSTPGTTARQRPRKELMQAQEVFHVSFVRRNQSHLAPPMLGLHCTHFLRHQYPSTPHPLFSTYPRTLHGPRILGGRDFTVPHWWTQQSAPLWRSSTHLHNGPLRSCRKIGGKAAVQQSRSRWARRNPSPRMTKVTVHEKREDNEKRPNPPNSPSHNHDSVAPRHHPLICTGAGPILLVHDQPMSLATKVIPRNEVILSPLPRAFFKHLRGQHVKKVLVSHLSPLSPCQRWPGINSPVPRRWQPGPDRCPHPCFCLFCFLFCLFVWFVCHGLLK